MAENSYDRELSDDSWSDHSEAEIGGSMELFLSRLYKLTIDISPYCHRPARDRKIEIYQLGNKSNSNLIFSANIIS